MLTLSKLQDNENNFHIPQPEATRPHLQGECVLTWGGECVLTWGRRVPEAADNIAFYRVKVFLFELF